MQKWTRYNSCKFQKQAAASNGASWLPPASSVWFTVSDLPDLEQEHKCWSDGCVKKTKKICFGVCIEPQLLQFITVTNYTPSILSSWFSRWSCNICLNFPLAKMYHCGCTDKYNFGFAAPHVFIHFIRVAILHHFEIAHKTEPQVPG